MSRISLFIGGIAPRRSTAEDIVKRVAGVRAIANELQVRIPIAGARNDTEIAEAAANALRWRGPRRATSASAAR